MNTEVLFLTDVPVAKQVQLARMLRGWTQWETAFHATEFMKQRGRPPIVKIQPSDISFLELGRRVKPWRREVILAVLGLQGGDDDR